VRIAWNEVSYSQPVKLRGRGTIIIVCKIMHTHYRLIPGSLLQIVTAVTTMRNGWTDQDIVKWAVVGWLVGWTILIGRST